MTQALRLIRSDEIDTGVSSDQGHPMGDRKFSQHVSDFLVARSYSQRSLYQRSSILRRFVLATGDPTPALLTGALILGWWAGLSALSPATRQAHLSAVRQFLAHVAAMGFPTIDAALIIKRPRAPRKPPVVLTPAEVARFLAWIEQPRDRAMVALMLGCGFRSSDVAALLVENVDLNGRLLAVEGKGGKTRLVPIPTSTVFCLHPWIRDRQSGPVFPGPGGPLGADRVRQRVTELLTLSGIKRAPNDGRSSHVLRRTCATTLLESGASVRDVQEILGHESLATTHAYLAVPEARRLVALIDGGPMPVIDLRDAA